MKEKSDVIVACEFSGIVRDAFIACGIPAVSCDLLPSERSGPHIQADVRTIDLSQFRLMIAHPPCTYLTNSGARWNVFRRKQQQDAVDFVLWLMNAPVPRIALENPIGILSSAYREPDQIIQPWQFGHGETKATCFWLKNLLALNSTGIVEGREHRVHRMAPGVDRWKERSRTLEGIAAAMAEQWGAGLYEDVSCSFGRFGQYQLM